MKPIKWILLVALVGLIFGLIMASGTAEGQGLSINGTKFDVSTKPPTPKEGWTIRLLKIGDSIEDVKGEWTTETNDKGFYEFLNLDADTYAIGEDLEPGWVRVFPIVRWTKLTLAQNNIVLDFKNKPLENRTCRTGCLWYIKNELYRAECGDLLEVPAGNGILANDLKGTTVIDPELITIDPKYGTLEVYEDGSFDYDPDLSIPSGTYVVFYYTATNGACEAANKGLAKIQVACRR